MPCPPLLRTLLASLLALFASATIASPGPDDLDSGVTLRIYRVEGDLRRIPELAPNQTPNLDERRSTIDLRTAADFGELPASIVSTVTGFLRIEEPGEYAFRLTSDDGSRLTIGRRLIIDHDGTHAATALSGRPIHLDAGLHDLLVEHFDHGGERRLTLEWRPPGAAAFSLVPADALFTERDLTRVTSPGFKALRAGNRPGDGLPVAGVHPGWDLTTIRPPGFEPKVGAMAFLPDGRLVVGTFSPLQRDDRALPDIDSKEPDKLYALSGVTGPEPKAVRVDVIADGLYEPCGLCVVDGDLYVAQRKAVTRLRDLDGDGFMETHETVGEGWEGWNYHQFVFGLVERNGLLYAGLSTAMAPPPWEGMGTNAAPNGPMRGGIIEIDPVSRDARVIAGGTRTPNGLGLGPEGTLFYLDNQGTWMPTSQMAEVVPGRFYGHYNRTNHVPKLADRFPEGGHPSALCDLPRTPAAVLMPQNEVSNSPTQPLLIEDGPFAGQMLVGELTAGGVRRVFLEPVNGQWQGALFRFTQGLESGVNRMAWGPDGALYVGGIGAGGNWNWNGTTFGLQRLAPNGRVVFEMHAVRATPDGFVVEFTKPVDRAWLADAANYRVRQWRYEPTAEYGGEKIDQEILHVRAAEPSEDGRAVRLRIDGLLPGRCVHLRTDPVSFDGEPIWSTEAWYTLNHIPRGDGPTPSRLGDRVIEPDALGVGALPPPHAVPLIGTTADAAFRRTVEKSPALPPSRTQDDLLGASGYVEVGKGSGDLVTRGLFGDCRLHLEWYCPEGGSGQMAANSGVYLQNLYELQVLGTPPGDGPLAENEAGAIYGVRPAAANASTGPGTWQAYDVWFRAARFENGVKTENARVTVYWNGVLVHDDVELAGPTGSRRAAGEPGGSEVQLGPLLLQDHASDASGPVRFRNVWIAPLVEPRAEPGPWVDLLRDGTLDGWLVRGGEADYRVETGEDGARIVGVSRPATPNTFLVTERAYDDFELLLEVRQHAELNSGVQIRSHVRGGMENRFGAVVGYQVELDPSERAFTGGLYDEQRRGWLHPLTDAPYARRADRPGDWNRIRIVAQGPVIRTWVNGVPAAAVFDAVDARGHIGLQVHGVGDRTDPVGVEFRNVRLRELRPAGPAKGSGLNAPKKKMPPEGLEPSTR